MTYLRPVSTGDALQALAHADGRGRPIVGGTDLLVGLRHHTLEPELVVDLKTVQDFATELEVTDDEVTVSPLITMSQLIAHPTVREWFPALVEAASTVGSVAIRNRASLAGNMCNGSPACDTAPPQLAHDVSVTVTSVDGDRTVPFDQFFLAPRRTECAVGQLVTAVHLHRPADGSGSAFQRLTRRRGVDLATVSVAARMDADGTTTLGLGAVGPTPVRVRLPEPVDPDDVSALDAALDNALRVAATPITDVRATERYRTAMIRVHARRAVLTAAARRRTASATSLPVPA